MRRFTSEDQIIKAIDTCYQKSQAFYKEAEEMDKQADELRGDPYHGERVKELRLAAKKKRTRAYNLVSKKAKHYGEKLSEFRTQAMAILEDSSIPQ